jgi:fluoride ion exporter CrcB/FEX
MIARLLCVIALVAFISVNDAFQMGISRMPFATARLKNKVLTTSQLQHQPTESTTSSLAFQSLGASSEQSFFQLASAATATAAGVAPTDAAAAAASTIKSATEPAKKTMKKIIPLSLMLFCILFNYTILRDTKDVLVVTAPNSGAEIIPFLKTYVNFPSSILITILYGWLSNQMASDKVFYVLLTGFLSFFAAFAGFICKKLVRLFCFLVVLLVFSSFSDPNRDLFHPNASADWLAMSLPKFFLVI